ncbi:MAG: C13 family peptidase [Sphingomonas sp.]
MRGRLKLIAALVLVLPAAASTQTFQPPRHTAGPSPLLTAGGPAEIARRADGGAQIESGRSPAGELEEHRRLNRALGALQPQRAGTADAYVVVVALDSDPVFGREARVAGEVLSRRYGATGRTIVLAGTDGRAPSSLPRGTPTSLAIAFARIAELMDEREDVLVLYTTSHGAPFGLFYHDADNGYGAISPTRMAAMLDGLGIRNRLLILSACYSGVFVPRLQSPTTAIVTAAASDRSSFGCVAENDWTFFGDAMINRALRAPQPLGQAFEQARTLVASWEQRIRGQPSNPQISVGAQAQRWLGVLEARLPPASQPVGRPAIESEGQAARR